MYPSPPPLPERSAGPPPYTPAEAHPGPRRRFAPWRSRTVRAIALAALLALSGVLILGIVRRQTGTEGFLVGLGLAVFPVPLLIAAFCWLDRIEPEPWRNLAFAFAWGACAATLVAVLANGFATDWLASNLATASPTEAEAWGSTVVAPIVEEVVKAAAIALLYRFRRRDFDGITAGIVIAGITATGFAFTENVLYLGSAFGEDQSMGHTGLTSLTAGTFFVRIVVSPFAHPLFTILTGLAFGIAATRYPRRRGARTGLVLLGLTTAILLHGVWNAASSLGDAGFLTVYGVFMVPVLLALTWLALWARRQELLSVREYLAPYTAAGWLAAPEPTALASLKTRALARDIARRTHGPAAARAVTAYGALATALSFHRRRAHLTGPTADFAARERELLDGLWHYRSWAGPALLQAWAGRTATPEAVPDRPGGAPGSDAATGRRPAP
ncbi:PrsW family intramembrane metalloprotease [Streptomyces sp. NPDC056149]|uniref:PrsW family intramembrane metalloprotease n=1 Tax=unclassified Streptomyces TaxID=2593676 RepID=UPI0023817274|nr:PrsW family intramembrane metalloprotease [Streptomyces sp. WZ-12]